MNTSKNAFCILCGGEGTRLGNLTAKMNKALLMVGDKPVIAHIIDKIPQDTDIVMSVGHQKESLIEFCEAAYPERKFIFVKLQNLNGIGSGPGNGIWECKEFLQRPFTYITNDCLVDESFPEPNTNWMGVHITSQPEIYSTAEVVNGKVINFVNKSPNGFKNAFIGMAGFKDYEVFWKILEEQRERQIAGQTDKIFEIISAFYEPDKYPVLTTKNFTWYDTGNTEAYEETQAAFAKKKLTSVV